MRLLVGDDVGQAKVIETSAGIDTTLATSKRATTNSFFPPSRTRPIQHALRVRYADRENLAAVFSRGGLLRIFDPLSSPSSPDIHFSHTLDVPVDTDTLALGVVGTTLYAATTIGQLLFLNLDSGEVRTITVPGPISAFAVSSDLSAIATGGEGREIEVLKATGDGKFEPAWKSRNVKPDHLKLEVPRHPSQIVFLPSAEGTWRLIVASHWGHLRVYDSAVAKRPVFTAEPSKTGIQALRPHPLSEIPSAEEPLVAAKGMESDRAHLVRDVRVVYTNTSGTFCVYSLRERRELGLFKGLEGAVKGVSVDAEAGLVAGVGLGRYLGVFDAETRQLKSRVYVKTQGCCVVILNGEDEVPEVPEKPEEEEDMWEGMEEVKSADKGDMTDRLVKVRVKRKKDGQRQEGGKKPRVAAE
ncbi:hypothetical protein FN846DRAFT_912930 [Sphaerosporella brunnea]|uniref:Ribosome biogenesis protein NSA1 n=1 Tax=Sphaerosporella brunnea TaxID=1250544 RepID=A0A5J5EGP0_9PEZI|nr:hypothetical protein FN846DRAFT_912930 [Sphaerosporella brunnea]